MERISDEGYPNKDTIHGYNKIRIWGNGTCGASLQPIDAIRFKSEIVNRRGDELARNIPSHIYTGNFPGIQSSLKSNECQQVLGKNFAVRKVDFIIFYFSFSSEPSPIRPDIEHGTIHPIIIALIRVSL